MKRESAFIMEVGPGCNNNCIFCMEKREKTVKSYSQKELEKAAKAHARVDISSGEPTLNKQLITHVRMAKKAGFESVEITTNGRMLAIPGFAQKLVDAGLDKFKISIHGSCPEIHNALTRTPESFSQAIAGLRKVAELKQEHELGLDILMTVTKLNYRDIPNAVRLFLEFPVNQIVMNVFDPVGHAEKMTEILLPRYSDIEQVLYETLVESEPILLSRRIGLSVSLPICVFRDRIKKYYCNYERMAQKNKKGMTEIPLRRGKSFIAVCDQCLVKDKCDGVWDKYLELYGDKEFSPVTDPEIAKLNKDFGF